MDISPPVGSRGLPARLQGERLGASVGARRSCSTARASAHDPPALGLLGPSGLGTWEAPSKVVQSPGDVSFSPLPGSWSPRAADCVQIPG